MKVQCFITSPEGNKPLLVDITKWNLLSIIPDDSRHAQKITLNSYPYECYISYTDFSNLKFLVDKRYFSCQKIGLWKRIKRGYQAFREAFLTKYEDRPWKQDNA